MRSRGKKKVEGKEEKEIKRKYRLLEIDTMNEKSQGNESTSARQEKGKHETEKRKKNDFFSLTFDC